MIRAWLTWCNDKILWGVPMLVLHFGTGIYLTFRLRFLQLRLRKLIRILFIRSDREEGKITSVQALCISLAGTIGTGNIAGVASAVTMGGPGAVFWMWVSAFFGMVTKYAEIVLSCRFRETDKKGIYHGGPMYVMRDGLGKYGKYMAVLFCIFGIVASFGIGNIIQVHTATYSVSEWLEGINSSIYSHKSFVVFIGIAMAIFTFLLLNGSAKSIGKATEALVPVMSGTYLILALCVIFSYIHQIGPVLCDILYGAFSPKAIIGGGTGITIHGAVHHGVARGIFSNEAGLGSSSVAHAASQNRDAAEEGLFGMIEVAFVTLLIGTITAFAILLPAKAGTFSIPYGSVSGAELTTRAMETVLPSALVKGVMTCILLCFALSTVLTWGYYGECFMMYLGGRRTAAVYRLLFCMTMMTASFLSSEDIWLLSDSFNALMAVPNLLSLLLLSGLVVSETRHGLSAMNSMLKQR